VVDRLHNDPLLDELEPLVAVSNQTVALDYATTRRRSPR